MSQVYMMIRLLFQLLRNYNPNLALTRGGAVQMDATIKNIMHYLSHRASGMLGRRKTLNVSICYLYLMNVT